MSRAILILSICCFAFSCDRHSVKPEECVKGKFLGSYCEGAVFQIIDDHKIGMDWKDMYGTRMYRNSIVATIDSTLGGSVHNWNSYVTTTDSVFFFKYRDGGYPRKQYNICEPDAFLTITFISQTGCSNNEQIK